MLFSVLTIKKAQTAASKRMQVAPGAKTLTLTPEGKAAITFSVIEFVFLIIAVVIAWSCGKENRENGPLVVINWICAFLFPMPYVIIAMLSAQCARDAIFKPLGFKAYEDDMLGAYYY